MEEVSITGDEDDEKPMSSGSTSTSRSSIGVDTDVVGGG